MDEDLDRVVPIVSLSLLVGLAVNVVYLWYDVQRFKSLSQIGSMVVSLLATIRVYQVFRLRVTLR